MGDIIELVEALASAQRDPIIAPFRKTIVAKRSTSDAHLDKRALQPDRPLVAVTRRHRLQVVHEARHPANRF